MPKIPVVWIQVIEIKEIKNIEISDKFIFKAYAMYKNNLNTYIEKLFVPSIKKKISSRTKDIGSSWVRFFLLHFWKEKERSDNQLCNLHNKYMYYNKHNYWKIIN